MALESGFQSSVLKYLNGLPGCVAENVSGNANQSGRADITGCYKGRMFKLELKQPDNKYKASLKQNLDLRRWHRSGCVIGVIYSKKALKALFEETDWNAPYSVSYRRKEANDCESWFTVGKLVWSTK